jgi:hypothetical protein
MQIDGKIKSEYEPNEPLGVQDTAASAVRSLQLEASNLKSSECPVRLTAICQDAKW